MSRKSSRVPKPRRRIEEEEDSAVDETEEEGDNSEDLEMSSDEGPCNGHTSVRSRVRSRAGERAETRSRSPVHHSSLEWKTEDDPDVAPAKLKFSPRRTPGVQPPVHLVRHTPVDIFGCFFDAEVLRLLCANTNKKAARNKERGRKFQWRDITVEELKKFLGLLLYMSVLNLPRMTDLWRRNTIFAIPFPATVMSRDRFKAILSSLYICDPAEDALNDRAKGTEEYDCLHRVRLLIEHMRIRCMAVYHPRQHISVDERMVATKARLSFKQYMKDKPTKWGLKFFVLADCNGYAVDFRLYTGKARESSGNGLSFDVVTSLVNREYLGTGYIVYCDNFYTSPQLFRHLGLQGFGACGTYRPGKVGAPQTEKNALTRRSPRGSIRWIRDGDLLFVKWMDTREVSMCTNVHSVHSGETVLRWKKNGEGSYEQVPVPRPTVVAEYNRYMGGVDTSDQMIGTNSVHRKTHRWHMIIFQHMLDIAVTNSFIVSKEQAANRRERPPTRQEFQEELCAQLLGVPLNTSAQQPQTSQMSSEDHYPGPTSRGQIQSQRASMGRRGCALCKRSTPWQCDVCGVGLCLQLERNCFRLYHKGPEAEV